MYNQSTNELRSLKLLLNEVVTSLSYMNEENFDSSLKNAVRCMEKSHALKNEIKVKYGTNVYKEFEPELNDVAKQIHSLFNNILQEKQQQIEIVSKELEFAQNKKNLSVYSR